MKKIICLVITLLMVVVINPVDFVSAKENDKQFLKESIYNHLLLSEHYKGNNIYEVSNSFTVEVFMDNEKSIVQTNKSNGELYITFENSVASSIALASGDTIKIMDIIDSKTISELSKGSSMSVLEINGIIYIYTGNNVICLNDDIDEVMKEKISNHFEDFTEHQGELLTVSTNMLDFSGIGVNASYNWSLPTKGQSPYYNGCWAACIASFNQFYNGTNTTVNNVVYDLTGSYNQVPAKSVSQVCSYLQYYYDIMTSSRSVSGNFCTYMRNDLASKKAYILLWRQQANDSLTGDYSVGYHFTVLKGYSQSGSTYSYSIMDPYYNSSMTGGTYTVSTTSSTSFPTNTHLYGGATGTLYGALYFGYLIVGAR